MLFKNYIEMTLNNKKWIILKKNFKLYLKKEMINLIRIYNNKYYK